MAKRKFAPSPHDLFFRLLFRHRDVAKDFVVNFLPVHVSAELDLDFFDLEPDSYLGEDLKQHFSDMVYLSRLRSGAPLRVAILFEHKSSSPKPDYPEHIQLLSYKTGIWQMDRKQKRKPTYVLPVIIHHGRRPWKTRPFWSVFEGLPESWREHTDDIRYYLADLSRWSDEEIAGAGERTFLATGFLAMKHAFDREFFRQGLGKLFKFGWVKSYNDATLSFLKSLFFYLEKISGMNTKELKKSAKSSELDQLLAEVTIPSIFEEGFEKGIEKGIEKNARKVVLKLLSKFPDFSDTLIADISGAPLEFVKQCRIDLKNEKKKG